MTILAAIAEEAQKRNLAFLLAGGHAVITHGYARNTFDLDLIIRRDDQPAWTELARKLNYQLFRQGPTFVQFNPAAPEFLPLDLMLVNQDTFAKLLAEAVPAPRPAGGARVVSLLHLLALKCHAIKHGHPGRVEKDVDDVIHLVRLNRLDVNQANIRALVLKHGPIELYEKLQRVFKPQ